MTEPTTTRSDIVVPNEVQNFGHPCFEKVLQQPHGVPPRGRLPAAPSLPTSQTSPTTPCAFAVVDNFIAKNAGLGLRNNPLLFSAPPPPSSSAAAHRRRRAPPGASTRSRACRSGSLRVSSGVRTLSSSSSCSCSSSAAHEDSSSTGVGAGGDPGGDTPDGRRRRRPVPEAAEPAAGPAAEAAAGPAAGSGRQHVRLRRHRGKQGGGWGGDGDGWESGMNLADREREARAVQVKIFSS